MRKDNRRPKILICDSISQIGVDMLNKLADVDIKTTMSSDELIGTIHEYDAVVVRSKTKITKDVIEHGLILKAIARAGSGLDNIDVAAAQERGVLVINSPDANTLAVAEHTMGLLLALARRLPRADWGLKRGIWEKTQLMGTGLSGKILGIVGFGRIGREVAIRAQAFGMKVLVNQRRPTPELNLEAGVEAVDLTDLMMKSDFVTVHVPSRPETKGLIGKEQLELMKPTAYLINTARGDVVDEDALLQALDMGAIMGAALDVFSSEPVENQALVQHERIIATPHIAASTEDAQNEAAVTIAEKLIELFEDIDVETVLPLRVVPLDLVYPHEHYDRRRAERLAKRLENEDFLLNPPIVISSEKGYMVLDGATRVTALKLLGFPHIVVQVIESEKDLQLHTWHHIIRRISLDELMRIARSVPEIMLVEVTAEEVQDAMFEYGGLCYLRTIDYKTYLVLPEPGANRLEVLNGFTNTYIEASYVSRTLNENFISLQHEYEDMVGVVMFPEYTVSQVMQAAQSGKMFPAGITRFVIPGRILRLKADLKLLRADVPLREKNRILHESLIEKQTRGKIRFYEEPVFVLDE